jgi:acetolactate synthase-1/2/3 large subunit
MIAEARGNPLALLELHRSVNPAQLAGGFEVPDVSSVPHRVEDSFRRRSGSLPAIAHPRAAVSQTLAALTAAVSYPVRGPVLLVVPLDHAMAACPDVTVAVSAAAPARRAPEGSVNSTVQMLARATRPLVVIGAGCREHSASVRHLVGTLKVPFVTTPRAKGLVSELHPYALRNGGLAASIWARNYTARPVDVALALGTDLDDSSIGPTPYLGKGGQLIHVDVNAAVFNRNLPTELGVQADVGEFARDLARAWVPSDQHAHRTQQLVDEVRKQSAFDAPDYADDIRWPVAPHRIVADLQAAAGPGARFITDIGEHMMFALHYLVAQGPDDFHIQLNLGSMGSGIAGATGLALADPSRRVVCICGDGGMQMAGMEVLTSVQERLPIVYAVFNDGRYNMVHHGMKQIFGEAAPHAAPWVDFAAWASALGVPAATITHAGEITESLLDELLREHKPAVLDIRVDRDVRIRGGGRVEALQHMSMLSDPATKAVTS